ncbi:hypothetical protein McpCs1_08240 [Methanocorpusculaceae archaeon Cs1]|uniref:Uncharacterized protein n=1 Tax=Methanorbis rubei TaxID=3028300 RepID=A0AAE4SC56_9EURY|nr:hypothetical protein [Methanocorpusculaceae archaeon Cs1]
MLSVAGIFRERRRPNFFLMLLNVRVLLFKLFKLRMFLLREVRIKFKINGSIRMRMLQSTDYVRARRSKRFGRRKNFGTTETSETVSGEVFRDLSIKYSMEFYTPCHV